MRRERKRGRLGAGQFLNAEWAFHANSGRPDAGRYAVICASELRFDAD